MKRLLTGVTFALLIVIVVIFASARVEGQNERNKLSQGLELGIGGDAPNLVSPVVKEDNNIISVLEKQGGFTIFIESIREAGLEDRLNGPEEFTVFAPTDRAFAIENEEVLFPIVTNRNRLRILIGSHIAQGKIESSDFDVLTGLKSIEGTDLKLSSNSANGKNILMKNIEAKNGVIHVVDSLFIPPQYLLKASEQI